MKFAVKMSHFLPILVSEKNAKCKKWFLQISDRQEETDEEI
jgi:hypothetical protein